MKEPVPVLCAANSNFIMPLCVMLASLVTNFDPTRKLALHIIENGFSDEDRSKVFQTLEMNRPGHENIEMTWHSFDRTRLHDQLPRHRRITSDAYSRLLAPFLLPSVERVIYLDCDLVVLTDISRLFDSTRGDAILHAVQEVAVPYISSPHGISDYEARGLLPQARMFNSGVLVMNLQRWRTEEVSERALDYLRHQPSVVFFMDQAALNTVLVNQWVPLDHQWNQAWPILFPQLWNAEGYTMKDWQVTIQSPFIVHYSGDDKPWNRDHLAPRSSYFFHFLEQTPFRGQVRKGLSARLESFLGFPVFFRVWTLTRHLVYWPRGKKYVDDQRSPDASLKLQELLSEAAPVPVLCAANSAYIMPLCVMLASLVRNFNPSRLLRIYIVGSDFTERDRQSVASTVTTNRPNLENVEIVWLTLDPGLLGNDLPRHERLSSDALIRLFAPQLLPHLDHLLYLDCDLVVERDLSVLFDTADRSASICAVHELAIPLISSPLGVHDYKELGIPPDARFFNTGVMMINLQKWRKEGIAESALDYLRRNGEKVYLLDQGALNAVQAEKWTPLDQTFNQSWTILFPSIWETAGYSREDWWAVWNHPSIVHFAGGDKPWNRDNFAPRASFFFRYLELTPFKGTVKKGLAATLECLLGFKTYYWIWYITRHIRCAILRKPFASA